MPVSASKSFDAPFQLDTSRPTSSNMEDNNMSVDPLKAKNEKQILDEASIKEKQASEKTLGKKFSRLLVTNIGMITVVLLYVFGGAYLFQILEQHDEISRCQSAEGQWTTQLQSMRSKLFNYIYLNTTSNPWIPFDNSSGLANTALTKDGPNIYNPKITSWLTQFSADVLSLQSTYKYNGQDCETQSMWTYFSALLFTFSVVSTIGYGHIAPTTWQGQLVCICYALLGVPLFLISIANLSGVFADSFRYAYANWFCYACRKYITKDEEKEKENDKVKEIEDLKEDEFTQASKAKVVDDDEDEEGDEESEHKKKVNVPLIIVLVLLYGYMVFGGWIFSLVEEWNLTMGTYFSFVSLATIGFGDLVPGIESLQSANTNKALQNMILAFFYIFVGMAIMAMSIDLMQDQLLTKFRTISEKFSLGKTYDNDAVVIGQNEIRAENDDHKSGESIQSDEQKVSKSEKLRLQLESIREKNKNRNLATSAENGTKTVKLESPNWKELLGVPKSSKSETPPVIENKRIIVKSLNETTRQSKDTEC